MKIDGSNTKEVVAKTEQKANGWELMFNDIKRQALPKIPAGTIGVDRFMESAKMALFDPKNPDLTRCSHESQIRSILQAANLGLEVGGVLGQSYLIPYNESVRNPKTGAFEKKMVCHFQIGYKGLITLARRSNTIKTIAAEIIYENDEFDCELASGRSIHHRMNIFAERGNVIGYYCLVELTNGGEQFAVMSKKDAEKFRDTYAKSYIMAKNKADQNWSKNFDAMALKTCVIKALKLCPISVEALRAVQQEEQNELENAPYEPETTAATPVEETKKVAKKAKKQPVVDAEFEVHNDDMQQDVKQQPEPPQQEEPQALTPDEEAAIDAEFDLFNK